ncbi:MAG: beta-galactosidase domain 4-containing protein, partial [Fimbriimonadales bacterium]
DKPFFLCEYAHAMGNAVGNLQEYVDTFYSSDRNMGGCIWDFVDQSLRKPDGSGGWYYAYGGDFDDHPNDGPFCNNGLIMPDRQITPKISEVKKAYQPVHITEENLLSGDIRVRNRHFFTSLSEFATDWHVTEDGKVIASGTINDLNTAPATEEIVRLRLPDTLPEPGAERFLRISFKLRQDTAWAARGHEIAWQQFKLPGGVEPKVAEIGPALTKVENATSVTISGRGFHANFDKATGTLSSYVVSGKEIIADGPKLNVFRAFVDNDVWFQKRFWDSGLGALAHRPVRFEVETLSQNAMRITIDQSVRGFKGTGFDHRAVYTVLGNGAIVIDNDFNPFGRLPPLPKLGLILSLNAGYDNFTWLGRGPLESYPDRKTAVDIGLYSGKVRDQFQEYVRPQENGNKEDVRWGALTDSQGNGVLFQSRGQLSMTVSHFRPEQIDDARHENGEPRKFNKLVPNPEVIVCLDARQMGLGGASCGPNPLGEYQCMPERTRFRVVFVPITAGDKPVQKGRIAQPVPKPPVIARSDEGMVSVEGEEIVVEVDGKPFGGVFPFDFARGGMIRAFANGVVNSPPAIAIFHPIIPVIPVTVVRAEASSFEPGEGDAMNAFDANLSTYWHTAYTRSEPAHPHSITAFLEVPSNIIGVDYTARQGNHNGRIDRFELYVSDNGTAFRKVADGRFNNAEGTQRVMLGAPQKGVNALRLVALSEVNGREWASAGELRILRAK